MRVDGRDRVELRLDASIGRGCTSVLSCSDRADPENNRHGQRKSRPTAANDTKHLHRSLPTRLSTAAYRRPRVPRFEPGRIVAAQLCSVLNNRDAEVVAISWTRA